MTFQSRVADIRLESRVGLTGTWLMSLNASEFLPGDTGSLAATTRSGTRLEIAVSEVVRDADGVLWHTTEKPLAAGTDVTGHVYGR
jgi:hypothetical protein